VRVGIALPQYEVDRDPAGPALFPAAVAAARRADDLGFDSAWLSDHPFAVAPDGSVSGAIEPLVTLAALTRATRRIVVGTLVLAATMRTAASVAHAAHTLPPHRTVIGVGAGWYEPEHRAFGVPLGSFAERADRLERTVSALRELTEPRPQVLIGGSGRRVVELAGRYADRWNVAWDVTPDVFASLSRGLDEACERAGRDAATVERSVGLTVLLAEDDRERDVALERLRRRAPFLADVDAASLTRNAIVGSARECVDRIAAYEADEVVLAPILRDDVELIERLATEVAPALRD
jgi:alkanesulfonate monooxygenase SsuD/methylene tetrahydromethanopterin reductase-like flavin-dependent oxidoreductase (luciferase family)